MPQDILGTNNGQQYYVGQNTPAPTSWDGSAGSGGSSPLRYTSPYVNGSDASGGLTPGYSTVNGQLTYTGAPSNSGGPASTGLMSLDQFSQQRGGNIDENAIRSQVAQRMQSQIDATNNYYADLLNQQGITNTNNSGKVRATDARSGLLGSDFGNAHAAGQDTANNNATKAIQDEQATKIAAIHGQIDSAAQAEITAKRTQAQGDADAYSKYLTDAQTKAKDAITAAGQSGVTATELKQSDPQRYAYLLQTSGMSEFELAQALAAASNGQLKTDTKIVGNTAYVTTYNPNTQKFDTHTQQFSAPDGSLVDLGNGNIMVQHTDPTTGKVTYEKAVPDKPVEVGNGGTLVDPNTGKVLYQAPYRTAGGAPGSSAPYVKGANPITDSWIAAVKNGNATMAQVPAAYKNMVAEGLNSSSSIVDPNTDAAVKAIIASNPGQYGHAADAIDAAFGKGTATKYDSQLKAVYNDKKDVATVFSQNGNYSPLAGSRFAADSNRITSNFINLPQYQLTANGLPYLQRIQAAMQNPGSISDQDLLDSLTKLNTAGNAISDAQVKLITDGQSYKDWASVLGNKFKNGGVLSDSQRQQIQTIANNIYSNYQKGYQPVYDQATSQLQAAGVPKAFWTIPDLNTLSSQNNNSGGGNSGDQAYQVNGVTYVQGSDGNYYPKQ